MRIRLSDLWRWDGAIGRGPYLLWGVLLMALKYNLDRLIAVTAFQLDWAFWNYFTSPFEAPITALTRSELAFVATMALLALPFVWAGVVLTVRRLRSAGLPMWLAVLFFLPLINLLFFAVLSLLPPGTRGPSPDQGLLDRVIPQSGFGSAAIAIGVTGGLGVLFTVLAVQGLAQYGWGLFVGVPFTLGFVAVLIYGYHRPRGLPECLLVGLGTVAMLGALLLALMIEGIVCLVMAAPLGGGLAALGALLGYGVQASPRYGRHGRWTGVMLLLFLPLIMGAEAGLGHRASLIAVRTAVTIQAPPEVVWRHVVSFSELPAPTHWVFKTGIAYPLRATIDGSGVGAVRRCEFSTGPFIEPITTWNEPHVLAFSVEAQPRPMKEISPHPNLEAPHLDDFLVCERGQFELTPTAGGGTHLEGTTWYRHRIWPSAYWRLFSDEILHRIHGRVLTHIQHLAEAEPQVRTGR